VEVYLENSFQSAFIESKEEHMPNPSIHAFAEKVALVTGVETPVGRAVAIQLALNGAFVTTVSSSPEGRDSIRGLLEIGTLSNHLTADVRSFEGSESVREDLASRFGRLDLLVQVRIVAQKLEGETEPEASANSLGNPLSSMMGLMRERPSPRIVEIILTEDLSDVTENAFRDSVSRSAAELGGKFRLNGIISRETPTSRGDDALLETRSGTDADDVARIAMFFLSGESKAVNGQVLTA
jgi:hypothetical protein